MLSNCFFWAHWRERQLWKEWHRQGRPVDRVPCIQRRPSRIEPHETRHWFVGWWVFSTRTLEDVESFVPLRPRKVPKWLIWTRILFEGRVKHGDNPSLPPDIQP